MKRLFRLVLLVALWLCAQLLLVTHGVGHVHDDDEICVECLALAGMQGAVPSAAAPLPPPATTGSVLVVAAPPAPTFAQHLSFRSRAPPAQS